MSDLSNTKRYILELPTKFQKHVGKVWEANVSNMSVALLAQQLNGLSNLFREAIDSVILTQLSNPDSYTQVDYEAIIRKVTAPEKFELGFLINTATDTRACLRWAYAENEEESPECLRGVTNKVLEITDDKFDIRKPYEVATMFNAEAVAKVFSVVAYNVISELLSQVDFQNHLGVIDTSDISGVIMSVNTAACVIVVEVLAYSELQ